MLRISLERPDPDSGAGVVIRLDGQVAGAWVNELRTACDSLAGGEGGRRQLTLDLSGVTSLGSDGIELIRNLRAGGARLQHASPYVTEQLRGTADVAG